MSGGAWALGGKISLAVLGLASNALLARLLSPTDLGAYFLAYSAVSLGALLGCMGLDQVVVRLVAEGMGLNLPGRTRRVIRMVLCTGCLGALSVGLAYLLFGDDLSRGVFQAPALAAITGLVAGWMVVATVQGLLGETFRGLHDIRLATVLGGQVTGTSSGLTTVSLLVASLFLLWTFQGEATLATVVLLAACSGCVSAVLAGWLLRIRLRTLPPRRPGEPKLALLEVLSMGWPLLVLSVTTVALRQGDLWVLGAFRPQEEVALYGAAVRLVSMVIMPLVIINAIAPPVIASLYAQGRREDLQRTLRAMATLTGLPALFALLACSLFAGPLLGFVYGDYYRQGAVVLALLSAGQFVSVWAGSCGLALTMTGHQKAAMSIGIISGVATLGLALGVVSHFGLVGVAASASLGLALRNIAMWFVARRRTGMWTHAGLGSLSELLRGLR